LDKTALLKNKLTKRRLSMEFQKYIIGNILYAAKLPINLPDGHGVKLGFETHIGSEFNNQATKIAEELLRLQGVDRNPKVLMILYYGQISCLEAKELALRLKEGKLEQDKSKLYEILALLACHFQFCPRGAVECTAAKELIRIDRKNSP